MEVFLTGNDCCASHKTVLVVGEGNFSFACEFVKCLRNTDWKIYATSFDSQDKVFNDEFAKQNVKDLESNSHVTVNHDVDATQLHETYPGLVCSLIIFNFPHVGGKSNIKKCRALLCNFFSSATKHLCEHGRILVSLCSGQGGTPADVSRGSYGNSWQVASQAAKAGLYLEGMEPFKFDMLETYKQAGYRGEIGRGFLTKGGLVHVFRRGEFINSSEFGARSSESDHSYDVENIRQQLRCRSKKTTDILEGRIHNAMGSFSHDFGIASFIQYDMEIYTHDVLNQLSKQTITAQSRNMGFNEVKDDCSITPISQTLMRHVAYTIPTANTTDIAVLKEIQTFLMNVLFVRFQCDVITCNCERLQTNCSCISGENTLCEKAFLKDLDAPAYNVDKVPYFIDDIPPSFWASFEPECTVSFEKNESDDIGYRIIPCCDYVLDEREKNYFCRNTISNETNSVGIHVKYTINGVCVATVLRVESKEATSIMIVFHISHIFFSCYNVNDLRFLHTNDQIFIGSLLACLTGDQGKRDVFIENHSNREYKTTVKYPLCHRHDLCFWMDELHTEKDLYKAMRLITRDYLHSVRLIKVLKHTETNLISYCYRMIYCRLDGPFHHEHCVGIQNELRKYLLKLEFKLR